MSIASALGLQVDDAVVVHNGGRIAVRLTPCDVLARIAPLAWGESRFEVDVALRLAEADSPVGEVEPRTEPRVHVRDGFTITLWTYYEPMAPADIAPAEYAHALLRLHAGLRQVDLEAPHFTYRVAGARSVAADRELSPELLEADRELLSNTLDLLGTAISSAGGRDQLLHGEPHPGNLLRTRKRLLFIDLGTCCRGPIEFDIAHGLLPAGVGGRVLAAEDVCEHYPGASHDLVDRCLILIWAMITTWRWRRDDQLPDGRYWRMEGLRQIRVALDRHGLGTAG